MSSPETSTIALTAFVDLRKVKKPEDLPQSLALQLGEMVASYQVASTEHDKPTAANIVAVFIALLHSRP